MKLGKMSIGSMNLDELLKSVWIPETSQSTRMEGTNGTSATLLQCQNSVGLSGALSEKIVDEKMKSSEGVKREPTTCEMTLEDFLTKEDAMDESSLSPVLPMDIPGTPQCFSQDIADTPVSLRRRNTSDIPDRSFEKRLKRKIKNRESAARSRARKQAYRNELVGKVSHLEEQNMRLKREKELENHLCFELSDEPRYQLRRTSSAVF